MSFHIDWFDGSLVENPKPSTYAEFADVEQSVSTEQKPAQTKNKPIGFKRLLDISMMEPNELIIEVTYRPGFWHLFDQEDLKADFMVLMVKILEKVFQNISHENPNSKLIKLLEKRVLSSDFLVMLTSYVKTLPNVKIVEKKMNTQLWDDVETFLFKVVSLCEGIMLFFGRQDKDIKRRLKELLKELCKSAIGVTEQHSERIGEDLYEKIFKLQKEIKDEDIPALAAVGIPSTDSFRNLNIFPTLHDMLSPHAAYRLDLADKQTKNKISSKIEPLLVHGAYPNVEHYLDVQFRLLREDYFGPLRKGISAYLENPAKIRHENIRVYHEVRILGTVVKNNNVGHLVDFAWRERITSNENIKENFDKKLMFGSLLLFTCDKFQTILCATVLDCDVKKLKEGYVVVSFQNPVSKNILSETYLMIESEVFFEPYHQVLKVLQGSRLDDLPMKKYIVDVKPESHPPAYLSLETQYTIEAPDKSEIPFTVLDINNWPTKHLDLDDSQLEAYKFALTREFAVIQGPPGTGKTFIAVKIASTILKNLSLEGTPMLVICYTNHALDQFLEGILKVTKSVIRLGSQSKSQKLQPYMLNNVKANMKCKSPFFYASKKELERIYEEIVQLQSEIENCETQILAYKNIKPYLVIDGKQYELKKSKEDRVLRWLFEHLDDTKQQFSQEQENDDEEETWEQLDEMDFNDGKVEGCFSEKMAKRQIEIINAQLRFYDGEDGNSFEATPLLLKKDEILKRMNFFKSKMKDFKKEKNFNVNEVKDLNDLSIEQRWQMYFNAANKVKDELLTKMDVLLEKHKTANKELEELSTLIDSEVVRTARVVGVTTTGAARRHQLIKKINSPIVIVEEAAEVLEAHIIASLTFSLQHLILIGDHKQLRPTAANYKLAKEFNIEVSLFERMIRNGIHARTLTTQRRMRPEFTQLLVPEIYPVLNSHESVLNYPHVNGMKKNLFFYDHDAMEKTEFAVDDSCTHENEHEARLCVDLARYLLNHEYAPADITILTTYNGQVSNMHEICLQCTSPDGQLLQKVKITTVDNFQGEESRIVILSLVRSNKENKIGFLSETNRICVALSRAKEGLYMFGNLGMLSMESPMWKTIKTKLELLNATGDSLPITSIKKWQSIMQNGYTCRLA